MIIKQILIVFLLLNLSQCFFSELAYKAMSSFAEATAETFGRATGKKISDVVYGDNED